MLYATSLKVSHLKLSGFYQIETLDPNEGEGYQRLLNESRAKRLAEYLVEGQRSQEAFLPTSIFLATDKTIEFNEESNTITIDVSATGPFNVVDGQHRIRGLVLAAEREPSLNDFEIPTILAVGLSPVSQMCHFLIVNTTQKPVDKAIEQQIVARLTSMIEFEPMPTLPKWIRRQVEKGEDRTSLDIVNHLNTAVGSPWRGKILMANTGPDDDANTTISQKSFVVSLKKAVLVPSNPISGPGWTVEKQQKALANYWTALANLLIDDNAETSNLFKTNGLHLFHAASAAVFLHAANLRQFTVDYFTEMLKQAFANLLPDFIDMSTSEFWARGGKASGLNQAAIRKYAQALSAALNAPSGGGEVRF